MFHFQAKKLLTTLLDEELSQKRRAKLLIHINSCSKCQQELDELKKLNTILDSLPKQESRTELYWQTQQKNILQKTQKAITVSENKPLPKPSRQIGWWKFVLAGSTVMVLCFVVWFNISHLPKEHAGAEKQSLATGIESYYIDNNKYPSAKQPEVTMSKKETNLSQSTAQKNAINKSLLEPEKPETLALAPAPIAAPQSSATRRLETSNRASEQESLDKLKDFNPTSGTNMPASPPALSTVIDGFALSSRQKNSLGINTAMKSDTITWGGSIQGGGLWEYKDKGLKTQSSITSISNDKEKLALSNSPEEKIESNKLKSAGIGGSIHSSNSITFNENTEMSSANPPKPLYREPSEKLALGYAQSKASSSTSQLFDSNGQILEYPDNRDRGTQREKVITLNFEFKNKNIREALETIATTAHIQILTISPQFAKRTTLELKSVTLDTALLKVGKFANLHYLTKYQDLYILTPLPFNLYTDKPGYASSSNLRVFIPAIPNKPFAFGKKYACPNCYDIILSPDWTYCPIDGSKIDKSIFKK